MTMREKGRVWAAAAAGEEVQAVADNLAAYRRAHRRYSVFSIGAELYERTLERFRSTVLPHLEPADYSDIGSLCEFADGAGAIRA